MTEKKSKSSSRGRKKCVYNVEDIVRSINDFLIFLDADGHFTDVFIPGQFKEDFPAPDEFIGKRYDSPGFPDKLVKHTHLAFENAKRNKPIPNVDYSLTINGAVHWYKASYSPFFNRDGEMAGMTMVVRENSDLVLMKDRIRQSELKYQGLIDNLGGVVYSIIPGETQPPEFFSDSVLSLTGYTPSQFISGKIKWNDLIRPEYRSQVSALWDEALKQKSYLDSEYEIVTATGETRWVNERGRATYDINGNPTSLDGYIYDATERVLAKQLGLQKEKELMSILESTGTLVAIVEPSGKIGYANSSFIEVTGYRPEELVGRKWYEFIPESERGWIEGLGKARFGGKSDIPSEYNQKIFHKDGHEISVFTIARLLPGTNRQIISMSDLSRLQKAQSEIQIQREKFEKFINSATEGFTLLDKNLNYTMVNETALRFFPRGTKLNDIIGKNITDVVPGIKGSSRLKAYYSVLETGTPYHASHIALGKDFNCRNISMKAFKVGDGLGQVFEDITERVHTEENLRVTNQQYHTLISNLQGVVYRCQNDKKWTMEFVSDGIRALAGYAAGDLINNRVIAFNDLILPGDRNYVWEEWQSKIKSREYASIEYRIRRKDGAIRWVHEKGTGVFNSEGVLTHLEGYIVDITDQREMQKNLRQSEKRFRNILETMKEGYYELDLSGKIVFLNDSLTKILNADPKKLSGKSLSTYIDASSSKTLKSALKTVLDDRTAIIKTLTLNNARKTVTEISISVKYDASGSPAGYKGILLDVSERQKSELLQNVIYEISESAHTSRDLDQLFKKIHSALNKVVDAANFFIAYYDKDENLLSFPYYKDEVDTFPNIARPLGKGLTEYVLRNGKPLLLTRDEILKMASAKEVNVIGTLPEQWIASPLHTEGKTVGVVAIQSYSDKNLYKKSDLEILNYISDQIALTMERKIIETRLRASEQKYRTMSNVLDESNQFKELLMDIVGHDLKTPAGVIQGFAELLYSEDPENEIAGHIFESAKNLVAIFNDLTVLNRTFGTEKLPLKILSLRETVETAVKSFKVILEENNMTLVNKIKKDYQFMGNPVISEVFKNYLSNAVKYAPEGRKIIISSKRKQRSVVVMVSDLGNTIPEKAREKIFFRSVQLQKSAAEGMGLGLAIVSRIAQLHGFMVWVQENQPTGNSFCIEIKLQSGNKS